ncbi:RDD family protein [candidate division KSB1 bacterium]|nr:RDD family protein [candidate division KSB1 bacterium]
MDYIVFRCPECGAKLGVKPEDAGLNAFCAKCSRRVKVPFESDKAESTKLVDQPIKETQHKTSEFTRVIDLAYAGFWRRFAAAFIDGLITTVLGFIAGGILGFIYGVSTGTAEGAEFLGQIAGLMVGWIYFASFESSTKQATLGKMALGIKVTDNNGDPVGFGKASGRHFGKLVSTLILFIGFIMVAFTQKKQGLHDMMAGCLVVNK